MTTPTPPTTTSRTATGSSRLDMLLELQRRREQRKKINAGRYAYDPVGFARDCIRWPEGEGLAFYQDQVLADLVEHHRESVRGPHGLGKTTTAAVAVLWFALTRDALGRDWKVITTAGSWAQLTDYLWPEIHKWGRLLRWSKLGRAPFDERSELTKLQLSLATGRVSAVASDNPALIEGAHADSLLFVYDESKAIGDETFDATEGAFSGAGADTAMEAFALATSTPGEPVGRFYDIHQRAKGLTDWHATHVTLDMTIAAGRNSSEWAEARAEQWGPDSAIYANRVLGEFHTADSDSIVPFEWVEAAIVRWKAWDAAGRPETPGRRIVSVDVAAGGETGDETIIGVRQGDVIQHLDAQPGADVITTAARMQTWLTWPQALGVVDDIGVGKGVYDALVAVGCNVVPFTASHKTEFVTRDGTHGFATLRSAAWWNLRELLDPMWGSNLMLPPNERMIRDLTVPKWREVPGSPRPRIQLEKREDIIKRLRRSPDAGTAVVQAFWVNGAPPPPEYETPAVARWAGTESYA